MIKIYYLLLLLLVLLVVISYTSYYNNSIESFAVSFGTPPETTQSDHSHIKGLLEIGSQAHENTTYDTVSTHYLGDIHRPTPPPPPPPPPDPLCFTSPSNPFRNNPTKLYLDTQDCCDNVTSYDDDDDDDD